MNEKELQLVQIRCQIIALEAVVSMILSGLASLPGAKTSLLQKLDELPQLVTKVSFPEYGPEYSDLFSAELSDAADSLVSFIKSHLSKK